MSPFDHQLNIGVLPLSCCCLSALFFCLPVFRLVFSCRPSVSPSTGHTVGLIVPAYSSINLGSLARATLQPFNLVSLDSASALLLYNRMSALFHFSFSIFCLFFYFPFCFFPFRYSYFFRVDVCTMAMFLVLFRCE